MATHALRAKDPETAHRLHAFAAIRDAAEFLRSLLRKDDLVVLKGSVNSDHLGRLAHHWLEPISCWRMNCGKNMPCSTCSELRADLERVDAAQLDGQTESDAMRRHDSIAAMLPDRAGHIRSEEHTSELQSLMRSSYAVFCLKNKKRSKNYRQTET